MVALYVPAGSAAPAVATTDIAAGVLVALNTARNHPVACPAPYEMAPASPATGLPLGSITLTSCAGVAPLPVAAANVSVLADTAKVGGGMMTVTCTVLGELDATGDSTGTFTTYRPLATPTGGATRMLRVAEATVRLSVAVTQPTGAPSVSVMAPIVS